jgi:hypothetical protein
MPSCTACESGKYKAALGSGSACTLCDGALEHSTSGLDSGSASCVCQAGYFLDAGACMACQRGTYKELQGNTTVGCAAPQQGCCACAAFETTASEASISALEACPCIHGHGVLEPSGFACVPCPRGTYKEGSDKDVCTACPAHTSTQEVGAFDAQECVPRAGYYAVGSTAAACAPGTYADHPNATACEQCFAGATSAAAAESIDACACQHPHAPSGALHDCTCAAGFARDSQACAACAANTFCAGARDTASACPQFAASPAGSDAAEDCECTAGYTGPNGGACAACPPGTFKAQPGAAACTSCPDSSASAAASDAAGDCLCNAGYSGANGGACAPCAAGTYKAELGAAACTSCPNSSVSAPASVAAEDCECMAGYTGPNGEACVRCPPGTFSSPAEGSGQLACVACPEHSTSTAGANDTADCLCEPGYTGENGGACAA